MTTLSINAETSVERVDLLIAQSDATYDEIDPIEAGEARYRRMLRLGINTVALALADGASYSEVGAHLIVMPTNVIHPGGQPFDTLANRYADITRATIDRNGQPESDARHAIHLMKLAAPYAQQYYPELDAHKIATYALIHDIIEAYAGDTPSLGMSEQVALQKEAAEAKALRTLSEHYGNDWPAFVELIERYEALDDDEARFTKTFDKLDPGFTHLAHPRSGPLIARYGTNNVAAFYRDIHTTTKRIAPYAQQFPELLDDRTELTHRVAAVLFSKVS